MTQRESAMNTSGVTYEVVHDTEYDYEWPVTLAQHVAILRPATHAAQTLHRHAVHVSPSPVDVTYSQDVYGNQLQHFSIAQSHQHLSVSSRSLVTVFPAASCDFSADQPWEDLAGQLRFQAGQPYCPAVEFRFPSQKIPLDPQIAEYARLSFLPGCGVYAGAKDLMHRLHADFRYVTGSTHVETSVQQAFVTRTGVCQDFAQVMICGLRSLGLAAQYVSGYLYTGSQHTSGLAEPSLTAMVGADASHAWVAVYCPPWGWVEFDPTNNILAGTGHIRVARGRDYVDVAPLRGVIVGGGEHQLRVGVRVLRCQQPD